MSSFYKPNKRETKAIRANYTYTDETLYLNGVEVTRPLSPVPKAKVMNTAVIIGVLTGRPPVKGKNFTFKPKYLVCEACGEDLPEDERRMLSAYHFQCWHDMVMEEREAGEIV